MEQRTTNPFIAQVADQSGEVIALVAAERECIAPRECWWPKCTCEVPHAATECTHGVLEVQPQQRRVPPMGSASASACGCHSYESDGVKTEFKCAAHRALGVPACCRGCEAGGPCERTAGVTALGHETFSHQTPTVDGDAQP